MTRLKQMKIAICAAVTALWSFGLSSVLAQDETPPTASAAVQAALLEAHDLLDEDKLNEALAHLDQIETEHAYDRAMIEQVRGFTYFSMQEHEASIAAFQAAMATGGLTEAQTQDFEYTVLQVSIASGDRDAILRALHEAQTPEQPESAFNTKLFAQAHMELEAYETALGYAQRARALHGRPDTFLDRMVRYLEVRTSEDN